MVNFGERLRNELRHEGWESHYIQYGSLKKILKKVYQLQSEGSFVEAGKLRRTFKTQLEEDIHSVDTWFIELCLKLFQQGVQLAKSVDECLHDDYAATLSVGKVSINSSLVVLSMDEKDQTKTQEEKEVDEEKEEGEEEEKKEEKEEEEEVEKDTQEEEHEENAEHAEKAEENSPKLHKKSKSAIARSAIESLVAFRREVKSIIKYAVINKEAVRKIVKKYDKNLGGNKLDSTRLEHVFEDLVTNKTEFTKSRDMPAIIQASELVARLRTQILLKNASFARYYDSLLRTTELTKTTTEDHGNAASSLPPTASSATTKDHDNTDTASILENMDDSHGSSSSSSSSSGANGNSSSASHIVPCPCGGYELQWFIQRPDDYVQKRHQLNATHKNKACGKYLPRRDYSHRRWALALCLLLLVILLGIVLNYGIQPERTQTLVYLGVIGAIVRETFFVVCIGVVNQKQIVANYDSSCMHVNLCFVVCVVVVNHIATTILPTFM